MIILNIQLLEHSIRSGQKPILDKVVLESLKLTSQNLKRFAQVQNFMLNLTRLSRNALCRNALSYTSELVTRLIFRTRSMITHTNLPFHLKYVTNSIAKKKKNWKYGN